MQDTTYNGWTNYETWRVNLEIFDNTTIQDFYDVEKVELHGLAEACKEYVIYLIDCENHNGKRSLTQDYAEAFVNNVDYRQIAKSLMETYEVEG
jgi:hypothetical protein